MSWRRLALVVLTIVLLLALPASVVLAGPLRSNGSPARLLGMLGLVLVIGGFVQRARGPRTAAGALLGCYGAVALVGYGTAYTRALSQIEVAGSLRALLFTFAATGAAGYLLWAVRTRRELDIVAGVLVGAATFSALLAVYQFYRPLDVAALVRPPGFVLNADVNTGERSDFVRVIGTAGHPIELGVILGALVPLAWHFASYAASRYARRVAAAAALVMLIAIPMAVARSGILTLAVAALVYSAVWTWRQRANALILAVVGALAFRSVVPGLLGTLRNLFLNTEQDTSIEARRDDYAYVTELFQQDPILGRGLGTFRPDQYIFLDNQWLLTLVEGGLVGVAALAALFLGGATLARGAYHRTSDPRTRSLAQALAGGILALGVSGLTFDLLSFPQAALLSFLLVAMAGALHRQVVTSDNSLAVDMQGANSDVNRGGAVPAE